MPPPASAAEPATEREFVITREFIAPARLLFEAWSRPEHIRRWFGPRGWPVTMCEMDFRVGGRFRFAMTGPSGVQNTPFGGTYLEIVPDRRIVYDNGFEEPGAERMVVTVTFDEKSRGRTVLTMHTLFASVAMKRLHVGGGFEQGTNSGFDQLAELVMEQRTQAALDGAAGGIAAAPQPVAAGGAPAGSGRRLIVSEFVTLDGVMEAPGGEPGHRHSGWVFDFMGAEQLQIKLQETLDAETLLIGRVTYESFAGAWPQRSGEFADKMNSMRKVVVSTTLRDPAWNNTEVIGADVPARIARLKQEPGGPILVAGSRMLVHTLLEHDLVDELRLMVFPVAVGSGQRLFPDTERKTVLKLAETRALATGVVMLTYARN